MTISSIRKLFGRQNIAFTSRNVELATGSEISLVAIIRPMQPLSQKAIQALISTVAVVKYLRFSSAERPSYRTLEASHADRSKKQMLGWGSF
jgi:hypothetical protein